MTTPLLNELLTEAVDLCDALSTQAQSAATAAEDVSAEAIALASLAESEAAQLHEEVVRVIAALHETGERTTAVVDRAIAALEGIPGRASESRSQVAGVFTALREEVLRLDEARQHLLEGLQTSGQAFDQDTEALSAAVEGYLTKVGEAWKKPMIAARALPSKALELRSHVEDRVALWRKDVEQLGVEALEQAQHFVEGIDAGAQGVGEHVKTTLDEATHRHNTLMQELRAGALDETAAGVPDPNWIDGAFDGLRAEIGNLDPVPGQIEEALFAPLSGIEGAAERAGAHLEAAAQSLAKVNAR